MRKPGFCLGENKDADQLCSNCTADQRLCLRRTDSSSTLIQNFKVLSLFLEPVSDWVGFLACYYHGSNRGLNRKKTLSL